MQNYKLDTVDENYSSSPLRVSMNLERTRAWDARNAGAPLGAPLQKPIHEQVYKDECSVLPENFLKGIDMDSLLSNNFKADYPHGTKCCLAILPFTDGCYGQNTLPPTKWKAFLEEKPSLYLRMLLVQSNGITHGFGDIPAHYFDFFPDILRMDVSEGGASFKVDYERNDDQDDRAWFLAQCNRALNNLRRFFGQETEKTSSAELLKLVK